MITAIAATILIVAIVASIGLQGPAGSPKQLNSAGPDTTTTEVTEPQTPPPPFTPSNPVYTSAGYPKISQVESNYTVYLRTENLTYRIGEMTVPAKSLDEAVRSAASAADLDPEKYSLAVATFSHGSIYNGSLDHHPHWYLSFARVYQGFWIWGSVGRERTSVYATVDASNGAVTNIVRDESHLPSGGRFELKVTAEQAIETMRRFRGRDIPDVLLENGTVTRLEPRIALLGPDSRNYALENPLDPSLSGTKKLYWVIELNSPKPQFGSRGTFLVNAETGELVAATSSLNFPGMRVPQVLVDIDYMAVESLAVSDQRFYINGEVLGVEGILPIVVADVIVVRPSGSGSISLNLESINIDEDKEVTLSMLNPLPASQAFTADSNPPGVNLRFERQRIVVPRDGSAQTTFFISADPDAPQKTYLLEIHATYNLPNWTSPAHGFTRFLLTVWDGEGEWPKPPQQD
jgi:hypothetical protein